MNVKRYGDMAFNCSTVGIIIIKSRLDFVIIMKFILLHDVYEYIWRSFTAWVSSETGQAGWSVGIALQHASSTTHLYFPFTADFTWTLLRFYSLVDCYAAINLLFLLQGGNHILTVRTRTTLVRSFLMANLMLTATHTSKHNCFSFYSCT